jgi:hypothetical protein
VIEALINKQTWMKKFLFFIVFISATKAIACDCQPATSINKDLLKIYDIIFLGKVDSVSACNTAGISEAYFTIEELYKGNAKQKLSVHFDCKSSCMMSFAKGDEWLIYGAYQRFDIISVKFCEHSRKHVLATDQDFYITTAQRTFDQEKEFLKTNLGIQSFIPTENWNKEQEELKPRNEQPSSNSKIYLLLVSFAAMILVYIITRKNKKKNG